VIIKPIELISRSVSMKGILMISHVIGFILRKERRMCCVGKVFGVKRIKYV